MKEPEGYSKKGKKGANKDGKTSENKASGAGKSASTTTGDQFVRLLYILLYSYNSCSDI